MARVSHKITTFIRDRTYRITGGLCWYCGAAAETIDHGHPLSRGGSKSPHNLYPSCKYCNNKKEDYTIEEFREWVFSKYTPSDNTSANFLLKQQVMKNKQFFGEEHDFHPPKEKREKRTYMNDPKAGYYSLAEKMGWSTD